MNNISVQVENSEYIKSSIINKVIIQVNSIELFKSITVVARLFNNDTLVDNKFFTIIDEEYANWGNDDSYIVNLILNKLGLTQVL